MHCVFTPFALILLAFLIPLVYSRTACPTGWTQNDRYCYLMITGPQQTWSDASDLCHGAGGELALPVTEDEVDFVWAMFRAQNLSRDEESLNGGLWMGCRRTSSPGGEWGCTGTPTLQFARWKTGQPDGSGDCVLMWYHVAKWADVSCDKPRFTACQRRLKGCTPHRRCLQVDSRPGCLLNHVLKEFPIKSPMQCCIACTDEPRCRSINLFGSTCQLNTAQRSDSTLSEDLATSNTCAYYEIL